MKSFIVYSTGLQRYLAQHGIYFFTCRPDRKDPTRVVYHYDDTQELRAKIKEWSKRNEENQH